MERRKFIRDGLLASMGVHLSQSAVVTGSTGTLLRGADPTGASDCTPAFQKAIAELPSSGGRLVIPPGLYRFNKSDETALHFSRFTDLAIHGQNSHLWFEGDTRPFLFEDCQRILIEGLNIDWPRPPFSQGTVLETGPKWFTVHIEPEFPVNEDEPIEAIGEYDSTARLPVANGLDLYGHIRAVRLVSHQVLRIELTQSVPLKAGATVVLRHRVYGVNIFLFQRCSDVQASDLTLHSAPGMGIVATSSRDLSFTRLAVVPTGDRLLSLNADALHLTDCTGQIEINGCHFKGMGDDAINVCATYWKVIGQQNPTMVEVEGRENASIASWRLPPPGSLVEFRRAEDLAFLNSAVVRARSQNGLVGRLTLQQASPIATGSLVCALPVDTRALITGCTFSGNRARAIVAHSNVRIIENTFSGQSLAAILLSADAKWMEGPTVSDVEIRENSFAHFYYGRADVRRGAITIDTAHDPTKIDFGDPRVNENVTISGNTFVPENAACIFVARTNSLTVINNGYGPQYPRPSASGQQQSPISVHNVQCAQLENNFPYAPTISSARHTSNR